MKPLNFPSTLLLTASILFLLNSCEEKSTTQDITITNLSETSIEKVVITSNNHSTIFPEIKINSSSSPHQINNLESEFELSIFVNGIEIFQYYTPPNEMKNVLDGKVYKTGEFEFSIHDIVLNENNGSNAAIVSLTSYQIL